MIAALCSLVTSSKLASGDWSPEPQIRKMERDATEVLSKAEAFLEYAEQVATIVPRRDKPYFISSGEGSGVIGGGWTNNLTGAAERDTSHLEMLWVDLEREKENVERCVKSMGLALSQGTNRRKNSIVIVDENLTIPFVLIGVQVILT
jgi:hypothetical protein